MVDSGDHCHFWHNTHWCPWTLRAIIKGGALRLYV
jgi:hypothetical protein